MEYFQLFFDQIHSLVYTIQLEQKNLHGNTTPEKLLLVKFEWHETTKYTKELIKHYKNDKKSILFEVDLKYPEQLGFANDELLFLREKMKIGTSGQLHIL